MKRPTPTLGELWYGANFWSRKGGPSMWRSYDPALIRHELAVLAGHGLNLTRSFFYWPDFQPEPNRIDEHLCELFDDFLQAHTECGMRTIPTFLVGHMSGENWSPSWRQGRDLYSDVWMVAREAWYIESLTRRFVAHPAVAGWLISNEMPIYGGPAATETVSAWAQLMVNAVRAGGAHQPVSIGDGAWGEEITGISNGFSVCELAQLTDYVGPHVYKMETDVVRSHLKAAFVCELAAVGNKPVVMEEFGVTTDFASDRNAGHYYRQLLNNTALAGSVGWIAWNNTDFDPLYTQRPYSHHPFELHFGITDATGQPKIPLLELQAFRQRLDSIDFAHCSRPDVAAALVVSSYLAEGYDSIDPAQRRLVATHAEQGYIAAKEADLPVAVIRESSEGSIPAGYGLYLLPSVKELTAPTWKQLIDLAKQGATVYASYCAGESDFQRGPWWVFTTELFGVSTELAYGLTTPIIDDEVVFTMTDSLGSLKAGDKLTFRVAGNQNSRSFLPVTVNPDAKVVAVDQHGRAALVVKQHGNGQAVLCSYPIEHFASKLASVNPEQTWRIYDAVADAAGIARSVRVDDPRVLVDSLVHEDGRRFWFFASQCPEELTVDVHSKTELRTLDGVPATRLTLPAYAVEVLLSAGKDNS